MVTKLSVNINKIATLRNARGGDVPNVVQVAIDCQRFGADGITVHPRPDERHIRYQDVRELRPVVTTEFNIEGNPTPEFIRLVTENRPEQVTLVPDSHDAITSNAGWNTVQNKAFLQEVTDEFHRYGIRVSIFVDPVMEMVTNAAECGADRVELYTEPYAALFPHDCLAAVDPFIAAALEARRVGLGLNGGHDLNRENLRYFAQQVPGLLEVSIGHALIADALYLGLENTINLYKRELASV
ncbi:MAG: pyridoxine 5'-phosphate synthase [Rikenellaceae bacterium]|jgi:pyridoxine 5-phosphate synthase|nr:pyridoxine 5'-phosphate synthase [Rikenellaceae bacterium]